MRRTAVLAASAAAALGVVVFQPLTGVAATLTVPSVSVPAVTVPAVTVPSLTTPVGTTPAVTTPAVTTPAVTTPAVTTPAVTTPVGQVPSVTTPSSASSPSSPVSALTQTASSVVGAAVNAVGGSARGAAGGTPGTATPSDPAATASTAVRGDLARVSAGRATTGTTRSATRHRTLVQRRSAARAAAESKRLRALVSRLRGCLATLNPGARRLLSLRAGVGGAPRSAVAVARILHVSRTREQLLEQLSVMQLSNDAAAPCAGAGVGSTASAGTAAPTDLLSGTAPGLGGAAPSAAAPPATAPPRGAITAARPAGHRGRGRQPNILITPAAVRTVEPAATGGEQFPRSVPACPPRTAPARDPGPGLPCRGPRLDRNRTGGRPPRDPDRRPGAGREPPDLAG
jgi:hypothetical protein